MKRKFIASLTVVAIFVLAVAAYAYNQNTNALATKASCCKSTDSCPMKAKGENAGGEHAKTSCCKKHSGENAKTENHSCDCCGDSCPIKKGEGEVASAEGKDCCDNCDCCKGKHETGASV